MAKAMIEKRVLEFNSFRVRQSAPPNAHRSNTQSHAQKHIRCNFLSQTALVVDSLNVPYTHTHKREEEPMRHLLMLLALRYG
jgi:hypothetical protein